MADQVGGAKGAYIIFLKYSSHLIFLQVLAASKRGVCYQQSVVVRFFFFWCGSQSSDIFTANGEQARDLRGMLE